MDSIFCPEGIIAMSNRPLFEPSNLLTVLPLELGHMYVSVSMKTKSIRSRSYSLVIIDDYIAYSNSFFSPARSQVHVALKKHFGRSERAIGYKLQSLRLDSAGEHKGELF